MKGGITWCFANNNDRRQQRASAWRRGPRGVPCSAFAGSSEPASQAGTPARPRPEAGEGRGGRCDRPHCDHPVTVVKWCHQQDGALRVPRETGSYVSRLVRAFRPSGNPTCYTNSCLDLSVSGHGAFCQNLLPPGGACLDSHH